MSLEYGNNFENNTPVVKTGISEPKEFKKPSDNINEINQREKIDKSISDIGLSKEETEEIINTIISKFGNDTKSIDSILETISKDISIDSKDKVIGVIVEAEKTKVEAEKTKVEAEVQSNVQEVKEDLQVYSKIEPLLSGLTGKDSVNLLKLLKDKDFEGVKKSLKNPDTFESVVGELEQKDPEKYKQFKETLISIDPSFRESFDNFDSKKSEISKILNLGTPKISADGKSGETTDGKHSIKIDDKGNRYLSSKDSSYQLKSNLDNKQNIEANQKIDTDLENSLKPINEKLNTFSNILDYLETAISNNIDLKDIKETIKKTDINLYNEYNIENLNSPNDIKNIISQAIKKLEDDKKSSIEKAKNLKRELILKNTREAKEQDEKKKEILKFLTSIGFDLIPQNITDQIVRELQSNVFTLGELNLNLKTIDLNNGRFGETDTESGGTKWKENLVKFMEKMIYGQIGAKESLFAGKGFSGVLGATVNPTEMNVTFEKAGIKTGTGWDINKMRQNLSKVK